MLLEQQTQVIIYLDAGEIILAMNRCEKSMGQLIFSAFAQECWCIFTACEQPTLER